MKMRTVKSSIVLFLLFGSQSTWALAGLSRACRWSEIPAYIRPAAAKMFSLIGSTQAGAYDFLNNLSSTQQASYFVLESLTIDWLSVRYYLYTEHKAYWSANNSLGWIPLRFKQSEGGWTAERVPDAVQNDPTLSSIFFHNRQFLYSARAGLPEIIERLTADYSYRVVANHYYYDPIGKSQGQLPRSEATNCNLTQWGLEAR